MTTPSIRAASQVLAHLPSLARHGSKPSRELPRSAEVAGQFNRSLRGFEDAMAYLPHQAYIGALHPRDLPGRPWVGRPPGDASRFGPDGEVMPEAEFLALMGLLDEFGLLALSPGTVSVGGAGLASHPFAKRFGLDRLEELEELAGDAEAAAAEPGSLSFLSGSELAGAFRRAHESDESLAAPVLLENLACKTSATLSLVHLLESCDIDPASVEYVMSCSEEAVGDRYQRGGGNMGKAVAEAAGCTEASGADIKNFCAAPLPAMVIAASLVASGVFRRVAVVAGGSLPKLGMKFQGQLKEGLPVLEDVVGGCSFLVEEAEPGSVVVRLDSVGRHRVAAGGANPQIMEALVVEPLKRLGMNLLDVDDYATELHNPEITEPQGSGNVPERNYKTIAALAVRAGDITREDMDSFVYERGMPGFAPTQGHLASALCYLPHALRRLSSQQAQRVHMIAKGSLFLGRMTQLSDGMSVILERGAES